MNLGISGVKIISRRLLGDYFILKIDPDVDPFNVAMSLFQSIKFDYVEFDALGSYTATPQDPYFQQQWNLDNTKLDMTLAWDISTGNNSVILAIIDSGTEFNHEDLDNNIWNNSDEESGDGNSDGYPGIAGVDDDGDGLIDEDSQDLQPGEPGYTNDLFEDDDENGFIDDFCGWDFLENDNSPTDILNHGTPVAGIAGAQTHNYENGAYRGVAGIAGGWGTSRGVVLMILKIKYDQGENIFVSSSAECITYAMENGADVMNMSWGWYNLYQWYEDVINEATNHYDCILIAGSGNDGYALLLYPARFTNTTAVGGTDENDNRRIYSNYGPELDVMAPSHVPTTIINNNYTSEFTGTSASSPHVAGIASLIRSLNQNLSWYDVRTILQNSADKVPGMGGQNRTDEYGYGRVNAHQSLLLTLAHSNKSQDPTATYSNSTRNQIKSAGYLHELFASGGEIFYRRSSNGGETFNVTERITTGNDNNQRACITCYTWIPSEQEFTTLAAVWERKIGDYQYEVWYSSSNAQTINWSAPQKLAEVRINSSYQSGALPVISHMEYLGEKRVVVVYCSQAGLHYRYYLPSLGTWVIPQPEIFDSSYKVRFPSLASGNNFLSVLYEIRGNNGVYSRIYNGANWTSSTYVADDIGTRFNRSPCITVDPEGHPLATWRGQIFNGVLDPYYSILFLYGYSNNSWSDWFELFEHPEEVSLYHASITYYKKTGINTYGIDIVHDNSINEIWRREYDIGDLWDDILVTSNGIYPNITEENYTSGDPVYCWTDQDGPPFTIKNNLSCTLPCHGEKLFLAGNGNGLTSLQHPVTQFIHKRRGVILDTISASQLILDIEPIVIQTISGEEIILPFKPVSAHQPVNLTSSNYNSYLGCDTLTLPSTSANLVFKSHVSVPAGTDSSGAVFNNIFTGKYSASLYVIDVLNPNSSLSINITQNSIVNVNLQGFAGRQVVIKPNVFLNNMSLSRLDFAVGNVYSPMLNLPKENMIKMSKSTFIPDKIVMVNNYPNPFNPTTTIAFDLPKDVTVSLEIYDVTGRKICTLVNEPKEAGTHQVMWDGQDDHGNSVASGVYVYRIQTGDFVQSKKLLFMK